MSIPRFNSRPYGSPIPEDTTFHFNPQTRRRYGVDYSILNSPSENDYYQQLALEEAQVEKDAWWFEHYDSEAARFNRLRDLGVNSLQAMSSILNSPSDAKAMPAPTPNPNHDSDIYEKLFGGVTSGLNSIVNAGIGIASMRSQVSKNKAEERYYDSLVPHTNEETRGMKIYNDNQPDIIESDIRNTNADTKVKEETAANLREERKVIQERYRLTVAEADLAEQQAAAFPSLNEVQLQIMRSEVAKNVATARESYASINRMTVQNQIDQADLNLREQKTQQDIQESQQRIAESAQNISESQAREKGIKEDTKFTESKRIAQEFVNSVEQNLGVPLTADAKDKISIWANNGDFDSIDNFLNATFDLADYEKRGSIRGKVLRLGNAENVGVGGKHRKYIKNRIFNPQ